jgi:hypothetical protein
MAENLLQQTQTLKNEVYQYCNNMLGGGMIDIELDQSHYQTALTKALARYRQKADSSVEESYLFLKLILDQNVYILPNEVIQVRSVFRRSVGSRTGGGDGGTIFEPFNLSYTMAYMLNSTNMGGILTYELFAEYQELVGRMFGAFIEFAWHPQSHKLTILQRPRSDEEVLLYCYNFRPDASILSDVYAGQWIRDYTLAACKEMIGQARGKFGSIAGPQGGSSLNGPEMKAEAQTEMEKLDKELETQVTGGRGFGFLIG